MIVKIQRPLMSSLPEEPDLALVYNKDRSYEAYLKLSDVIDLFKHNESKIYHFAKTSLDKGFYPVDFKTGVTINVSLKTDYISEAILPSNKRLNIGKRVESQPW